MLPYAPKPSPQSNPQGTSTLTVAQQSHERGCYTQPASYVPSQEPEQSPEADTTQQDMLDPPNYHKALYLIISPWAQAKDNGLEKPANGVRAR